MGSFSVSCKFKSVVDQFGWAFAGVYGPNSVRDRRLLREELFGLRNCGIFLGVWEVTLMW